MSDRRYFERTLEVLDRPPDRRARILEPTETLVIGDGYGTYYCGGCFAVLVAELKGDSTLVVAGYTELVIRCFKCRAYCLISSNLT